MLLAELWSRAAGGAFRNFLCIEGQAHVHSPFCLANPKVKLCYGLLSQHDNGTVFSSWHEFEGVPDRLPQHNDSLANISRF